MRGKTVLYPCVQNYSLLRNTRHQPANVFPSLPNYPIVCGPGLDVSFVRDISSFQVSCWFILTKSM